MPSPGAQLGFLRSVLSEPSGEGSAARLGALLTVATALTWESYMLLRFGHLTDLEPLAVFVASIVGTLYGTNKLSAAIATKAGCDAGNDTEQPQS